MAMIGFGPRTIYSAVKIASMLDEMAKWPYQYFKHWVEISFSESSGDSFLSINTKPFLFFYGNLYW